MRIMLFRTFLLKPIIPWSTFPGKCGGNSQEYSVLETSLRRLLPPRGGEQNDTLMQDDAKDLFALP